MTDLRSELPELPASMKRLPVGDRGYPVPFFVAWLDDDQKPVKRGEGTPDFRILHPGVVTDCYAGDKCWVCGGNFRTSYRAFVLGPMCAVNRTSAEPPSHIDCATFSAIACPFLARPHARRRDVENMVQKADVPGTMIERNPGVTGVWTAHQSSYKPYQVPPAHGGGTLFDVGEPTSIDWYREGREATYEEVMASIDSGYPLLEEQANKQGGGAMTQLENQLAEATELVRKTTQEVSAA